MTDAQQTTAFSSIPPERKAYLRSLGSMATKIGNLEAEVATLREALKPFADFAKNLDADRADDECPDIDYGQGYGSCLCCVVTAGDVRRAARAMEASA